MVAMLAIYCLIGMVSKYTDQVYLDLCLFIPAVKNTGMPNSPRDTTGDAKSTQGIWYEDVKSPRVYYSGMP